MGIVCENCGWRESPNDNTGRGCIFSNAKKKWEIGQYNKACSNYIMDTELTRHLIELLGIDNQVKKPQDKGAAIISEVLDFYKKYQHTKKEIEWDTLHTAVEELYKKYDESEFLLVLLKETSRYIERKNQISM